MAATIFYTGGKILHARFPNFMTTLESKGRSAHDVKRDDLYSIGGAMQLVGTAWWVDVHAPSHRRTYMPVRRPLTVAPSATSAF